MGEYLQSKQTFPLPETYSDRYDPTKEKVPPHHFDGASAWLIQKTGGAVWTYDPKLEEAMKEEGYTDKEIKDQPIQSVVTNQKYMAKEQSREANFTSRGYDDEMVTAVKEQYGSDFSDNKERQLKYFEEQRKLEAAIATASNGFLKTKVARISKLIDSAEAQVRDPAIRTVYDNVISNNSIDADFDIIKWISQQGSGKLRKELVGAITAVGPDAKRKLEEILDRYEERHNIFNDEMATGYFLDKHLKGEHHVLSGMEEADNVLSNTELTRTEKRAHISALMPALRKNYPNKMKDYDGKGMRKLAQNAIAQAERLGALWDKLDEYQGQLEGLAVSKPGPWAEGIEGEDVTADLTAFRKLRDDFTSFLVPEKQSPPDVEDTVRDALKIWYHGVTSTPGGLEAMEEVGRITEVEKRDGFFYGEPDPETGLPEFKDVSVGMGGADISLWHVNSMRAFSKYTSDVYRLLRGNEFDLSSEKMLEKIYKLGQKASVKIRNAAEDAKFANERKMLKALGTEYKSMIRTR